MKLSIPQRLALIKQGEAALARNAASNGRDMTDIHFQLALLHKANGRAENAIHHLTKVIKARKKDKDALAQLADIHAQTKNYVQAKKYIRKLVEAYPRDEFTLIYQAEFLEKIGQPRQAAAVWEKTIRLFPGNPENYHSLAACKRQFGDWEGAKALHAKVLELEPTHASSLYMMANSEQHEPKSAHKLIGAIKRSINSGGDDCEPIDRANLYYALGKLYSDLGEYAEAMEAYQNANDQRDETPWPDIQRSFENIRSAYTRQVIVEKSRSAYGPDAPVFILGMPRSGTTLTESLLGAHSEVLAGDELPFMGQIASRLGTTRGKTDPFTTLLSSIQETLVAAMRRDYLAATEHLRRGQAHYTDKMPHNFMHIGLIRILFPNAKIIHCRRHPIDNCLSLYTNSMTPYHNGYKTNLKTLGLYYRQYVQLMEHWRREVPGGFHEVFYEDLVANTELNARAMIDYLGLAWEDSVMKRENSQKSIRTLSVWQVRQPVYTSSAGRWKNFEPYLGELIDALGGTITEYESELAGLGEQAPA